MRIVALAAMTVGILGAASLCSAQSRQPFGGQSGAPTGGSLGTTSRMSTPTSSYGGSTSSGMFGNRTLGSSLRPGQRSFGGTARGGVAGGNVAGMTQQDNSFGQITGTERFTRGGRQQQGFIGNESGDVAGFFSMLTGGRTGNVQTNNQRRRDPEAQQNVNTGGQQNNQNNQRRMYRTTRTVAFDYTPSASPDLSATVSRRIQRAPAIRTRSAIDVQIVGRTAVLRGVVATQHDRELAERLASLEPGVSTVQNELEVAQSPPAPLAAEGPALTDPADSNQP
jgi:osmotically-inducible protein OsmY